MELRGNTWHFPHALTAMPEADGAERYVAQLRNFIPFGSRLRTALDIGAGVGGFAVELLRQGMITVSLGPRDGFRGQAQFALERGLPALVGILATTRLPFPSLAFDLVHCSHCQVPFGLPNGTHLFEVDRLLRPGGFFVLAGPPVRWAGRAAEWRALRDKARALCWRLVLVVPHVAIWRKSRGVEVAEGSGGSGGERRWCPGAKGFREAEQEGDGTAEREEGGSEREEVEESQEEGAEGEERGVEREVGGAESGEGGGKREEEGAEGEDGRAEREEGGAEGDELGGDVTGEKEGEEKREEEAGEGEGEMGAEVLPLAALRHPPSPLHLEPPPLAASPVVRLPRIYAAPLMHPPPDAPRNAWGAGAEGRAEEKGKGKEGTKGKGTGDGGKRRSGKGWNEDEEEGMQAGEEKGPKQGEEKGVKEGRNKAGQQYSKRQGTALAALSPRQKRMNMESKRWGKRLAHYDSLFLGALLGHEGQRKRCKGAEGDGGEAKGEESEEKGRSREESGPGKVRNVLDMNAGVGSFAAALQGREEDGEERVWVMNVVPVSSRLNTLSAVFDRGMVGTLHDWCEAFSSYPRTYDLVHWQGVSSSFHPDRCDIDDVIIEVDRLLRPGGTVVIRDLPDVLEGVQRAARAAHWNVTAYLPEKGSSREQLLVARKPLWKVDARGLGSQMIAGGEAVPLVRAGVGAVSIHGRGSALSSCPLLESARYESVPRSPTSFISAGSRLPRRFACPRDVLSVESKIEPRASCDRVESGRAGRGADYGRTAAAVPRCRSGNRRALAPRAGLGDGVGSGAAESSRGGGLYLEGAARFWRDARSAYSADALGAEMAAIALPALLALAAEPVASLVDTFYIGQMGAEELGGVGVAVAVVGVVSKVLNVPLLNITTSFVAQDQHLLAQSPQQQPHQQLQGSPSVPSASSSASSSASAASPQPACKPVVPSVSAALLVAMVLGALEALLLALAAAPLLAVMGVGPLSPMHAPALQYLQVRAVGAPAVVLFLTAQGVFRGLKDTRTPLAASVSGNVVNILLDPLLIFSCGLGVSGAAAATVAAQYGMAAWLLLRLSSTVQLIPPSLSLLSFDRFFKSGGLLLGRTVALLGAMAVGTSMAARQGAVPMAAHQLALQLCLAASLLSDSVALAAQTLLSSAFARNDTAMVRAIMLRSLQIGLGMGEVMGVVLSLSAQLLPSIFTSDDRVLLQAVSLMPFAAAMQPMASMAFVFDGLHYGATDFAFAALAMMALAPAAVAVLVYAPSEWGVEGVWIGLSLLMAARMFAGFLRVGTGGGAWAVLQAPPPRVHMSPAKAHDGRHAFTANSTAGDSSDVHQDGHTATAEAILAGSATARSPAEEAGVESDMARLAVADATDGKPAGAGADVDELDDVEQTEVVLFHLKECYVYKIPPRKTAASYRADEWDINRWAWEGAISVVSRGDHCSIRLLDSATGDLFAHAPVRPNHPLPLEAVIDSSRFFVLRIEDSSPPPPSASSSSASSTKGGKPAAGTAAAAVAPVVRHAFIGLGFRERTAAYDFQAAVYDHVKYVHKQQEARRMGQAFESRPAADYRLKEGQKLHLDIKTPARAKPSTAGLPLSPTTPGNVAFKSPSLTGAAPDASAPMRQASGDHAAADSSPPHATAAGTTAGASPPILPPPPPARLSSPPSASPSSPPSTSFSARSFPPAAPSPSIAWAFQSDDPPAPVTSAPQSIMPATSGGNEGAGSSSSSSSGGGRR
ncbi:unnamed protein product [Closterium sp. Yama58-4]|nr:unnamed protein product [Closterium sp. Yama58-4]